MVESPASPATLHTATWSIRWLFVAVDKSMLTYDHFSHPLRSMSPPPPQNLEHLIPVYLFLLITGGHILLPIIIITALLHKKLSWHPTLLNLCITWVLFSVIHCLYLYAGGNVYYGYDVVCMVQAAMLYGASPMAIVAGLCVVIHAWTTIQPFERNFAERLPRWFYRFLVMSPPYIVFAGFSIGAGIVVKQHGDVANPSNGLFCTFYVQSLILPVPIFCAAVMVLVVCFEAAITIRYYQRWKRIRNSFPLMARRPSTSLVFRVGLFCLYSLTTLIAVVLFLTSQPLDVTCMVLAALPLATALVFGLQKDMLHAWFGVCSRTQPAARTTPEIPNARQTRSNSSSQSAA